MKLSATHCRSDDGWDVKENGHDRIPIKEHEYSRNQVREKSEYASERSNRRETSMADLRDHEVNQTITEDHLRQSGLSELAARSLA